MAFLNSDVNMYSTNLWACLPVSTNHSIYVLSRPKCFKRCTPPPSQPMPIRGYVELLTSSTGGGRAGEVDEDPQSVSSGVAITGHCRESTVISLCSIMYCRLVTSDL